MQFASSAPLHVNIATSCLAKPSHCTTSAHAAYCSSEKISTATCNKGPQSPSCLSFERYKRVHSIDRVTPDCCLLFQLRESSNGIVSILYIFFLIFFSSSFFLHADGADVRLRTCTTTVVLLVSILASGTELLCVAMFVNQIHSTHKTKIICKWKRVLFKSQCSGCITW